MPLTAPIVIKDPKARPACRPDRSRAVGRQCRALRALQGALQGAWWYLHLRRAAGGLGLDTWAPGARRQSSRMIAGAKETCSPVLELAPAPCEGQALHAPRTEVASSPRQPPRQPALGHQQRGLPLSLSLSLSLHPTLFLSGPGDGGLLISLP